MRPHVGLALKERLTARAARAPQPTAPDTRAEDITFAAGSTLLFMGLNSLAPVAGGVVAACVVAGANSARRAQEGALPTLDHVHEAVAGALRGRTLPVATPASVAWQAWLPWDKLHDGEVVEVPAFLPHPLEAGFEYTQLAARCGQRHNWVVSMADGSRLHVHEYPDGHCEVHRDRLDPARDPATATFHWLSEAREGQLLLGTVALGAVLATWLWEAP